MDYAIIDRAGITRAEFADLVGVSRVMAWKYITKGIEPRDRVKGAKTRTRVIVALLVLTKLVEKGALPKPHLAVTTAMHPEIRKARESMMTKLKALIDERVEKEPANG